MSDGSGQFRGQRIDKPWGYELLWARTERYVGKLLHIDAGHALSLQFHRKKDETLYLLSGELELQVDDRAGILRTMVLEPGGSLHVWPGRRHRLVARTSCDVMEVSTPEVDDVVRLSDRYERTGEG